MGIILILPFVLINIAYGQSVENQYEITIQFTKETFKMSENSNSITSLEDLVKLEPSLNRIFRNGNISKISRTIPFSQQNDSIRVNKLGKNIRLHDVNDIYTITFNGRSLGILKKLKESPFVLFAEENYSKTPDSFTPDDEYFMSQWAIRDAVRGINAEQAWTITRGSSNNIIGIFDSGVESFHTEIGYKLISPNQGSSNSVSSGWHSHGFAVAGIATAITDNDYGISGIDWYAKIYSRRMDNTSNSQDYNSIMNMIDNNVNIINMSYKMSSYSTLIRKALANAYNMNITLVASMGNDNYGNTNYPAGFGQGIIAVGATNFNRDRWQAPEFENPRRGSNWGSHIDISAPGFAFAPEKPGNVQQNDNDDYIQLFQATSAAAPQISGIASLLLAYRSDLYNDDIENLIKLSAKTTPTMNDLGVEWHEEYGHGIADAFEALKLLQSPYTLTHHTVGSGTNIGNTNGYWMYLYGFDGLNDGNYRVKRHEVTKVITYPYMDDSNVWCRGADDNGYSSESPNFAMGWCQPIYFNNDIAQLRTYVYEVYSPFGSYTPPFFLGWYPSHPDDVKFSYTVHGIQSSQPFTAEIFGPVNVQTGQTGQWFASASGGQTPYSYTWQRSTSSSNGPWKTVGSNSSYSQPVFGDMWLKLTAVESCGGGLCPSAYDVQFISSTGIPLKEINNQDSGFIPDNFDLLGNYPNPFNPSTNIGYDISEQSDVLIEVYNLFGQKVKTLVDESQSQGRYTAVFDARNMASGVYITRLIATGQSGTRFQKTIKMLLVK